MVKITVGIEGVACGMCEAHINEVVEYSCAMKSHFRKSGNQMTGRRKSSNARLLAQCFI